MQDSMKTRGATQCTSPRWRSDDEWQHLEDSYRSGEMATATKTVNLATSVKGKVAFVLKEQPIGWKEEWVWTQAPSLDDSHECKITFYGNNRFRYAYARYEGKYGVWMVNLLPDAGVSWKEEESRKIHPAIRTGKASCLEPSDEWQESSSESKERLAQWMEQGVSLTLLPVERVSWRKVE